MNRGFFVALALAGAVLLSYERAPAQPRGPGEGTGFGASFGRPLFLEHLYRPELIMRNQAALGLTAEQRASISTAMRDTQARLSPLQWDLDAKAEEVAKLVDAPKVDTAAALASASQVIDLEGKIKKEHLQLLLTIKNVLTPEQQAKLRELRSERFGDRDRDGRPGPTFRRERRFGGPGHPPPPGAPLGAPGGPPPPPPDDLDEPPA